MIFWNRHAIGTCVYWQHVHAYCPCIIVNIRSDNTVNVEDYHDHDMHLCGAYAFMLTAALAVAAGVPSPPVPDDQAPPSSYKVSRRSNVWHALVCINAVWCPPNVVARAEIAAVQRPINVACR